MLFTEEETPLLKQWIIKRLEKSSDADADVLADYVLALLRHDGDVDSVRQLCEAEVPDFLNEDSSTFVQDVFDAIQYKSFVPGAPPPPPRAAALPFAPPTGPAAASYSGLGVPNAPLGPLNGTRKRSYNDRGDGDSQDRGFQQGGDPNNRVFKQPRRGGGYGRGNYDNHRGGRGGYDNRSGPMDLQRMMPPGYPDLPPMPIPPPGMPPFDPSNPMATVLAMQAMGLPLPGMPQLPQSNSPGARPSSGPPAGRKKARCRDYDEKGFCARGNTCMFEHGDNPIWVPPQAGDEYDPSQSNIMTGIETSSGPPTRGNDRGRGRGRGDGRGGSRRGGRSEFSSDRPNFDKSNTTIVVESIPEDKFTEDEVRGFFSEFGTITEVSMRPYKRLALVKFETWDSAQAAYKSPKVIFDNRFVKVYWFTNKESLPQPPAVGTNGSVKHASSAPAPATRPEPEPQIDIEEFTRKQQDVQKAHEEKKKKMQEVEAARKELEKRQEDLLKSQAEEKRRLLERIAAKSGKSGSPPNGAANGAPAGEGKGTGQTEALKAQLAALEEEAKSLGIDPSLADDSSYPPRGGYRGRGYRGRGAYNPRGYRGGYRGRGGASLGGGGSVMRLDNRPKKISLTGVDFSDPEKDESLRQYLLGLGEYTSLEITPAVTTITFKERFIAEKFMYETPGAEIPSVGKVEMAWVATPLPPVNLATLKVAPIAGQPDATRRAAEAAAGSGEGTSDVHMSTGDDEGAMGLGAVDSGHHGAGGGGDAQENIDYDVADDEWS